MSFFALFTMVSALTPSFIGLTIARAFQGIDTWLAEHPNRLAYIFNRDRCSVYDSPSPSSHRYLFHGPQEKGDGIRLLGSCRLSRFYVCHHNTFNICQAHTKRSVGLILGGVLTDLLTWRWIFWISLILSGVVIPSAMLVLPYPQPKRQPRPEHSRNNEDSGDQQTSPKGVPILLRERMIRFDVLGIFLGIPGLLILNYALTSANTDGWGSGQIIGPLVAAVVLLTLFLLHERRATTPLLPSRLFHDVSFNLTLVLAVNTYAVRQACTYFLTIQLQAQGNSPIHTAVLFIPLGISALIFNSLAGRLVPKLGARVMVSQVQRPDPWHIFANYPALVHRRLGALHSRRRLVFVHKPNDFLLAIYLSRDDFIYRRTRLGVHHRELRRRLFGLQVRSGRRSCHLQRRTPSRRLRPWARRLDRCGAGHG